MAAAEALASVLARVRTASAAAGRARDVRLVAVSKIKPASLVQEVYDRGHRHFGENYVQELVAKAPELPSDICWHFIGQLQSNKAKTLVSGVPNLWAVESVDSVKLANKLNSASGEFRAEPLNVYVQVNTSAEPQKGGVDPDRAQDLAKHVTESCPNLRLCGLMTIGKLGSPAAVYFERLAEARARVAEALSVESSSLELSMGMSSDFELAIEHGADSVRVGTTIFGARPKKAAAGTDAAAGAAGGGEAGAGGAEAEAAASASSS